MRTAGSDRVPSVQAIWDNEAKVWVALSDDIPGLVAEASSLDDLFRNLQELIPELLVLNGMAQVDHAPFQLVANNGTAGVGAS